MVDPVKDGKGTLLPTDGTLLPADGSNPDSEPRIVSSATSLPGAAPLPSATHDATARSYLPQSMSNKAHFLLPLRLFFRSVRFTSLFGPWSSVELRSEVEVGEGVQRQIQGKRNTPSLSRSTGPVQVYKAGDSLCNAASGGLVGSKLDPAPLQGQVEQLNVRLQALESNREFMKQTIDSLKREKEELTLLKDIAQRLRELKPPSKSPKVVKSPTPQEDASVLNFMKAMLSFSI